MLRSKMQHHVQLFNMFMVIDTPVYTTNFLGPKNSALVGFVGPAYDALDTPKQKNLPLQN